MRAFDRTYEIAKCLAKSFRVRLAVGPWLVAVAGSLLLIGCRPSVKPPPVLTAQMRLGMDSAQIVDALEHLKSTDTPATFYEGLPSRYKPAYKSEREREDVTTFAEDDFYDHPAQLDGATGAQLRQVLGSIDTYLPKSTKTAMAFTQTGH